MSNAYIAWMSPDTGVVFSTDDTVGKIDFPLNHVLVAFFVCSEKFVLNIVLMQLIVCNPMWSIIEWTRLAKDLALFILHCSL